MGVSRCIAASLAYNRRGSSHFDLIARYRIECWRTRRKSIAKIEASMVPRAADSAIHDQSLRQRSTLMGTDRAQGKEPVTLPCKNHCRAINVAQQNSAIGELVDRNPPTKVGPFQWFGCLCHGVVLDAFRGPRFPLLLQHCAARMICR